MHWRLFTTMFLLFVAIESAYAQRRGDLGEDRKLAESHNWIYDDFDAAVSQAKQSGKPILVVIRCPP